MPRVISGVLRGRILDTPHGTKTRPTSDRAKEALFSILSPRISGTHFLDLFAGSGQMGIEALSRGAAGAVFVDSDFESVKCIGSNLQKLLLSDRAKIHKEDVFRFLNRYIPVRPFDFVYIDPPYSDAIGVFRKICENLDPELMISGSAVIMLEHDSKAIPEDFVINMKLKRCCKYGTVMISFYERCDPSDESCSAGGAAR